jgi:hypothetical protein
VRWRIPVLVVEKVEAVDRETEAVEEVVVMPVILLVLEEGTTAEGEMGEEKDVEEE